MNFLCTLSACFGAGEFNKGLLQNGESIRGLGYHSYYYGGDNESLESNPSLCSEAGKINFLCLSRSVPGDSLSLYNKAG